MSELEALLKEFLLAGVQPRGEWEEVAFGRHVDEDVLALGRLVQSVSEI